MSAYSSPVDDDEDFAQPRTLWKTYEKFSEDEVILHNLSRNMAQSVARGAGEDGGDVEEGGGGDWREAEAGVGGEV